MGEIAINQQQLDRINKGTTFFNIGERYNGKKYYIKVFLKISQNLKEKEEKIEVDSNLPVSSSYWDRENEVNQFLEKLKNYVNRPLANIRIPAKSVISTWELSSIRDNLRRETLTFSDIEFEIGDLARKRIGNFEEQVKEILGEQKEDNSTQKKVNSYVRVMEKVYSLKNLLCKKDHQETDETIKLPITPEEYNTKLKEIEKELRVLEKEFNLREANLEYIEIKEGTSYSEWLKEHRDELKENFEENGDDNEMTFDEYAEMMYREFEEEE